MAINFLTNSECLRPIISRGEQNFREGYRSSIRCLAMPLQKPGGSTVKTAKKHILDQRLRVERQREFLRSRNLERDGPPDALADARWRLALMEQTLARMEAEYTTEPEKFWRALPDQLER